jgi:NTE family protein
MEYFSKTNKISEADVRYLNSEFSVFGIVGENYLMNLGLRSEYYRFIPFDFDEDVYNLQKSEETVLSGFFNLRFENLDDKYYPRNGFDLNAEFSYASNKVDNIIENTTTPILLYNLKSAFSLGSDLTIIPHLYGRLLLNDNSATFRSNLMGGPEVTQILSYQLPFIGLERAVILKDKLFVGKLEVRGRITENNYLSVIANIATHFNKFSDWSTRELIGGYGLNTPTTVLLVQLICYSQHRTTPMRSTSL